MELDNNVVLRPRFHKDVDLTFSEIIANATKIKEDVKEDYRVKISDHHIFLFIILAKRRYYSPHLHIQLIEKEDKTTHIKCLFGLFSFWDVCYFRLDVENFSNYRLNCCILDDFYLVLTLFHCKTNTVQWSPSNS